jgi:hypothetical protein
MVTIHFGCNSPSYACNGRKWTGIWKGGGDGPDGFKGNK